ncbi:MAG: hypothetical protein EOO43_05390 [Flavobacterium sp.]|nr:MAG: hypothetical protein EOO43_05390 [Flavobacterium sp.]
MTINTLLHRQVHPNWIQHNIVSEQAFATSQTFVPTAKDSGLLSVYNGDKFTAEHSLNHFTDNPDCSSAGVLSITVGEVDSIGDLTAVDDDYPFDGHAHIDFTQVTSVKSVKKKAQKLRDLAMLRGWVYKL